MGARQGPGKAFGCACVYGPPPPSPVTLSIRGCAGGAASLECTARFSFFFFLSFFFVFFHLEHPWVCGRRCIPRMDGEVPILKASVIGGPDECEHAVTEEHGEPSKECDRVHQPNQAVRVR